MRWRMEVLAFFSCASAFNTVHTNSNSVVRSVNHRSIRGMTVPTLHFAPSAITPQKIPTNLKENAISEITWSEAEPNEHFYSKNLISRTLAEAQRLTSRRRCGRSGVRFPGRSVGHSANDSPPLPNLLELGGPGIKPPRWAPQLVTGNTASIMKI